MELFSELYNCYYQVVDHILREASAHPISQKRIQAICKEIGFAESSFYILPKLFDGTWHLLSCDGTHYQSLTGEPQSLPLTLLQRSWLKSLLLESRFCLFFTEEEQEALARYTEDAKVLWRPKDFHYFDQYADGDDYTSPTYRAHFQILLTAIQKRQYVHISYHSMKGHRIAHHYLPLKLEYSAKNDQFRLLAIPEYSHILQNINLKGIQTVTLLSRFLEEDFDFAAMIRKSYYHEPVRLLIKNQRNALERAMLHFANYEKKTKKIDENTWECLIYYNSSMETELLIEVLSFGPAIQVLGPASFLNQVKYRLSRQIKLFANSSYVTPS